MKISEKTDVRKNLLKTRKSLNKAFIEYHSNHIIVQILEDPNFINSNNIGIYLPVNNELDLTRLLSLKGKTFYVPKTIDDEIIFVKITKETPLIKGPYQIDEPASGEVAEKIDYLITPSLAIYQNRRLGYGGGYYDKYISKNRPTFVVGVIYDFQEVEFKYDDLDELLDYYFVSKKEI
jgi:5-formyltetrahydrofolate cyclo-ligase